MIKIKKENTRLTDALGLPRIESYVIKGWYRPEGLGSFYRYHRNSPIDKATHGMLTYSKAILIGLV